MPGKRKSTMKKTLCLRSLCGLLLLSFATARGGGPAARPPEDYTSLKIDQTWQPVFPYQAMVLGFQSGEAHVVIDVDATGKLTDWLVIGYNYPAFAEQAVAAVKKWKFEPARMQGNPVPVVARIDFNFEKEGLTIITQSVEENLKERFLELDKDQYSYRVHLLQELDHIPRPIHIVQPVYPQDWANQGIVGVVTVEFYIDETGRVRMPATVNNGAPPLLVNLALRAVQQWQFEPATCKGKPVLVRVSQNFRFGSNAPSP